MGYNRYKIAKSGSMVGDIYVFTEFEENWKYFFNETTMVVDTPGDVDKIVNVRATSVKRGPGDPSPFTRKATTRIYARHAKNKGSARPGNPYIVAEKNVLGPGYREKRQFAILGRDMDVFAYAKAKAKFIITLWSPNGWHDEIEPAAGGTLIAPTGGTIKP